MTQYNPAWLDRMYNNRALVPEHGAHFARWAADSAAARRDTPHHEDLRYGDGPNETLDIFPGGGRADRVLFFIHGGYWRSLDKSDHSFVAPPFVQRGVCVVVPNYALCPGTPEQPVTIPMIALQTARALAWTWRHVAQYGGDPRRIVVAGHSAGGHLTAMMAACRWPQLAADLPAGLVQGGLAVSGLYELESIMHTPFLQESLRLTPADALRASPAWMPAPARGPVFAVAGADESAEFLRHNALLQQAWGERVVPVREAHVGRNHFSILEALADPGQRLHQLALQLLDVG